MKNLPHILRIMALLTQNLIYNFNVLLYGYFFIVTKCRNKCKFSVILQRDVKIILTPKLVRLDSLYEVLNLVDIFNLVLRLPSGRAWLEQTKTK